MNPLTGESWKERSRQILDLAREYEYKETENGIRLNAYIYTPRKETRDLRPAMIFFADSLWDNMSVTQFGPQCLHFAERGVVTILAEYRTRFAHQATPVDAMSDARSAIRWIRYNAEALGVDPARIVAAGGSAGAHMVLSAAMIPGVADDRNDPDLSCVPDALVLFTPIVDLAVKGASMVGRFPSPEQAQICNPSRYIGKHLPPTIIFQGTGDRVVPYEPVVKFVKAAKKKNNTVHLCLFTGLSHSFYNFNVNPDGFDAVMAEIDRFLVGLNFLAPNEQPEEDLGDKLTGGWGY